MEKKGLFLVLISAILVINFANQERSRNLQWGGKIVEENGSRIIKNPEEPLYGEITLDLEKELSIGKDDENFYFFRYVDVKIDSDGNILILDTGNDRIQKFDENGAYLQTIGRPGQGPGEFFDPSWMYLDSTDNIYVKDKMQVDIFGKNGKFRTTYTLPCNIVSFCITSKGNVLARTFFRKEHCIHVLNSEWNVINTVVSFPWVTNAVLNNPYRPDLWFCPINDELSVYGYPSMYKLSVVNSSGEIVYFIEKEERLKEKSLVKKEKEKLIDYHQELDKARGKDAKHRTRSYIETFLAFSEKKASYDRIFSDDKSRIYVRQVDTIYTEEEGAEYDMFSKDGYYIYRVKIPLKINYGPWGMIKNGYLYDVVEDSETFNKIVIKYKIRNWDQIKEGN
ncbi:6-bladed beta-propeller [Acidobacteriota bacterium]